MASNKYQLARIRIIDRELQRKKRVKTKDLVRIISEELDIRVSSRTIQNDISLMQYDSTLAYYAPIENDTKAKAWYYSDSTYTITAFKLREEEVKSLSFYANMLGAYREVGIFNHFSGAIEKIMDAVKIQTSTFSTSARINSIIQIDKTTPSVGNEYFPKIITALQEHRMLQIIYQKFAGDEKKTYQVSPYLLKSFENRWYLVTKRENRIITLGIDRIRAIEVLENRFKKEQIDFEEYFRHSMGITVTDIEPVEIKLSFAPLQGKYIKSLPLHKSQKVLADNEKEFRISIYVRPTFEFYSKVISYGASVKVLSPCSVIKELKNRLTETMSLYSE